MKNRKPVWGTENNNTGKITTNQDGCGTCTDAGKKQNAHNDIEQEASWEQEEGQTPKKVAQQRPG